MTHNPPATEGLAAGLAELLPCPFCGAGAEYSGKEGAGYFVQCTKCLCKGAWGDYGYQAREAWNRRPVAIVLDGLLPCPFCGNSARVIYSDRGETFSVRCNSWTGSAGSNSCMGSGAYAGTEEEAIAAWNRRAPASSGEMARFCAEIAWDTAFAWAIDHGRTDQEAYDAASAVRENVLVHALQDDALSTQAIVARNAVIEEMAEALRKCLYTSTGNKIAAENVYTFERAAKALEAFRALRAAEARQL